MLQRWTAGLLLLVALAAGFSACERETTLSPGASEKAADGVQLYKLNDPGLLDPSGIVAIQILTLYPAKVELRCALSHDRPMSLETVPDIAARNKRIGVLIFGVGPRDGG